MASGVPPSVACPAAQAMMMRSMPANCLKLIADSLAPGESHWLPKVEMKTIETGLRQWRDFTDIGDCGCSGESDVSFRQGTGSILLVSVS